MITVIITSYKEPKSTLKATQIILAQLKKLKKDFKIVVCDPFPEVEEFLREHIKEKKFEFFPDPGEGKPYALNLLFEQYFSANKDDILIFTDGDVFLGENAIKEIMSAFEDKTVGCVTGRPIPINPKNNKFGYWAHVVYKGIDKTRQRLDKEKKFFQSTGYLFAIRNSLITDIPLDVPEDAVIPYLIWKKGYRNKYAPKATVYVKYPDNFQDWLNQRVRTIKAHENVSKLIPDMPRTKSFFNEIKEGVLFVLLQPRTPVQFFWTMELCIARLYIYQKSFADIKNKKAFDPGWRETEIKSTNPLGER
ncbi:glycosyltransferase [Candidatus Pacearchaeota archaeon]|nr:glycosyltransferase [Candidatus Pacearchaeota archaeon]